RQRGQEHRVRQPPRGHGARAVPLLLAQRPWAARRQNLLDRYEQNHLALGEYEKAASPPYDGLAITWFASTAEMRSGAATAEYAATRADEANFLPGGHLPIIITRERVVV